MTIEHFGCSEWEDLLRGSNLFFAPTGKLVQTQVFVTDPAFQGRTPGPADPTLLEIFNDSIAGAYDRAAMLSGGVFLGEGGGFHAAGVPTIGYYRCRSTSVRWPPTEKSRSWIRSISMTRW
jgi:hypothetical protein